MGMNDDAPGATRRLRANASRLALEGPRPGASWCEAWTAEVDATLQGLHASLDEVTRRGVTLVAVGGYGRRELCPSSDVDLLVLHAGLERDALEQLVRTVIYPLWDVGLTVGYAVRTRREAIAATDELDAATALLDARLLAGDAGLASQVRSEVLRRIVRRPQRLLEQLLQADDERHARARTPTETLEPDLKLGAGGLRDIQSLRWGAAASAFSVTSRLAATARVTLGPLLPEGSGNLLILQLSGGNDGLNTVVPYGDDDYNRARPTLAKKADELFVLDTYRGLHSNLTGLVEGWEAGELAIIEGCGYPDPNRSHFKSMDIWHTGHVEGRDSGPGWIGRLASELFKDDVLPEAFACANIVMQDKSGGQSAAVHIPMPWALAVAV